MTARPASWSARQAARLSGPGNVPIMLIGEARELTDEERRGA